MTLAGGHDCTHGGEALPRFGKSQGQIISPARWRVKEEHLFMLVDNDQSIRSRIQY